MIPTLESLNRANAIIQQIESLQAELAALFGSNAKPTGTRRGRPPGSGRPVAAANGELAKARRRTMSLEARARIAAAQKARWAKFHAERRKGR